MSKSDEITVDSNGTYSVTYTAPCYEEGISVLTLETDLGFYDVNNTTITPLAVSVAEDDGTVRGVYSTNESDQGFANAFTREKAKESTRRVNIKNKYNAYTEDDGYTALDNGKTVDAFSTEDKTVSVPVWKGDQVTVYFSVSNLPSGNEPATLSVPETQEDTRELQATSFTTTLVDNDSDEGDSVTVKGNGIYRIDVTSSKTKSDIQYLGLETDLSFYGSGNITMKALAVKVAEDDGYTEIKDGTTVDALGGESIEVRKGDTISLYFEVLGMDTYDSENSLSAEDIPEAVEANRTPVSTETPSQDIVIITTQEPASSTEATKAPATDTQNSGSLVDAAGEAAAYVVAGTDIATGNTTKDGYLNVPQVQLTWDSNRSCDGYQIWKSKGDGSFSKVDEIDDVDETEWNDTDIEKGCTYNYKVLGYKNDDFGSVVVAEQGDVVTVTIRKTVNSPTFTAKRTGKNLKITFKKAEGTKCQIQVKYGDSGNGRRSTPS